MRPIFQRTHQNVAVYRLLVPLPVCVDWPSGRQTLHAEQNGPHRGSLVLTGPGKLQSTYHDYKSADHVRHHLANGYLVKVPSVENTLFERLAKDGRAEVVWGRCERIYWLDQSITRHLPQVDHFHGFQSETHTSATLAWAKREGPASGDHSGSNP